MRDHAQKEDDEEINMTPMLDIVFIMLIFFIVTAVFVKEAGIEVAKPETESAIPQQNISILIGLTADNEIWINRTEVDLESVRTTVEKLHAENPKGAVAIQPDAESDATVLLKLYNAIRDAGVERVAIATELE